MYNITNPELYQYAGYYKINKLDLVAANGTVIDLRGIFVSFNLYESIYADGLSGNVAVTDVYDLINEFGIYGHETLDVEVETPGIEGSVMSKTFNVYAIINQTISGQHSQLYSLAFSSQEPMSDKVLTINEAVSGTASDMAKFAFSKLKSDKPIDIEETRDLFKFIIPYWSPMFMINWLTKRSVSTKGNVGYLFFENRNGYNYKSVQSLYKQDPILEFDRDSQMHMGKINDMSINDSKLILDKLLDGSLASTSQSFDISTKKLNTYTYNHNDDFSESKSLSKYATPVPIEINHEKSNIFFHVKQSKQFDKNDTYDETNIKYKSVVKQIDNKSLMIEVHGNFSIPVGTTCIVNLPRVSNTETDKYIDEFYSGKYLIAELRHSIVGAEHKTILTINSDSYETQI